MVSRNLRGCIPPVTSGRRRLVCLLFGFAVLVAGRCSNEPELPVLYAVPSAILTSQDARAVNLQQFEGFVTVYDFIFTSCSGVCPLMTRTMSSLVKSVDPSEPVRFVSISVDPERDTPARLARYASSAGRDSRWTFLRTDKDQAFLLSQRGFKLSAGENAPAVPDPVYHSPRFVLVDRKGYIRGYYDATMPGKVQELKRDIARLARQ